MREAEIKKRKERVDDPSKCNLVFEYFTPPRSCVYPLTAPPYYGPPEYKRCENLILLNESVRDITWKCKLTKHPYIKTIDK